MGATKTAAALARHDDRLEAKAARLLVVKLSGDSYGVASATTPGRLYTVEYRRDGAWCCECVGSARGAMCAHQRAARRYRARRGLATRGGAT